MASLATAVPVMGGPAAAQVPTASAAPSEALSPESKASELAAESGERVEIAPATTETSQIFANPDGTFTQETSAAPVRAKQGDGSWADIDTTLVRAADGTIRARSTATEVEFSGGGSGSDMVTLDDHGRELTFGWPTALPEPQLDGSVATYVDVLPGVDLKLTAVSRGFTQVLVVKNAEAAANPALATLNITAEGEDLSLVPGLDGGFVALDENGAKVFEGPAGRMWDSAGDTAQPQAPAVTRMSTVAVSTSAEARGDGGPDDPAAGPGPGDTTADVALKIKGSTLELAPDLSLLRGKDTVYPLYVDPPTKGVVRGDWTALSSDGDRFWEWDGDKGTGRCSNYDGYLCSSSPYTQRLYFEYPLSSLYGKKVLDVTFSAYQTWTFTCDAHWYDLSLVNKDISSSTTWTTRPIATDLMGDRNVSYGRGGLCSPSQPANWVRFSDNVADEADENLTLKVREYVEAKKAAITFSLTAHDESNAASWARFRDDALLSVTYVSYPGKPTTVGVQQGNAGQACNTSALPLSTSDTTPKMIATVQSADGSNSQLRALFEVWKADGSSRAWSAFSPSEAWVADNAKRDASPTTALPPQTDYRMRVKTQAYFKSDRGSTGVLDSAWSSWCYFRVDTDSPPPPNVTSADGLYQPAETNPASGAVGTAGKFTFTPADTNANTAGIQSDVVTYKWRLNSGAVSNPINVAKGSPTTVSITPDQAGENTIQVWGYDAAVHSSLTGFYSFLVNGAEKPTGIWHLDNDGTDSTTATQHPLTLSSASSGSGYSLLERSGTRSLRIDGSTSFAQTSTAVLDTAKSFSASVWVRLQDTARNYTALSQAGTNASGFQLAYSSANNAWVFSRHGSDVSSATITRSIATKPPVLNAWTHLTGVYDAAGHTIQLYVNGRAQGEPVKFTTPWKASGALQVARLRYDATWGEYFNGRIDEAKVWARALADTEVVQDARLEDEDISDGMAGDPITTLLGDWDATDTALAQGTTISDRSDYIRPMSLNGTTLGIDPDTADNADLGLPTRQVMSLNGTSSYATTDGPLVDDTGSFTATAWVRLDGTKLSDTTKAYSLQVFGQPGATQSSWGLWYEQPTGESTGRWKFGRPSKDGTGATWTTQDSAVAQKNTWVRLTVVYDAQYASDDDADSTKRGAILLYVDSTRVASEGGSAYIAPWQGAGKFEVGRGRVDGAASRYFPGHIANVRVWAGAMDDGTIADLYNAEQ